uniref:Peptidase metallopeptidase domain-containing protein n=1 Tax=Ciona savignyi TaxID=51511 RepID=H2YRF5_CIOSA
MQEDVLPRNVSIQKLTKLLTNYMNRFGYTNLTTENEVDLMTTSRDDSDSRDPHRYYVIALDKHVSQQIETMQDNLGLPVTGKLDKETLETLLLPRCGMRDIEPSGDAGNFVLQGSWLKHDLTYRVLNITHRLTAKEFHDTMARAIQMWAEVTPLTIKRVEATSTADIDIYFADGSHGDGYNFDGIGGTLAHGFYPPAAWEDQDIPTLAGDIHFDLAEKFVTNSHKGVDILQ